jgi:hypothetical protein
MRHTDSGGSWFACFIVLLVFIFPYFAITVIKSANAAIRKRRADRLFKRKCHEVVERLNQFNLQRFQKAVEELDRRKIVVEEIPFRNERCKRAIPEIYTTFSDYVDSVMNAPEFPHPPLDILTPSDLQSIGWKTPRKGFSTEEEEG